MFVKARDGTYFQRELKHLKQLQNFEQFHGQKLEEFCYFAELLAFLS